MSNVADGNPGSHGTGYYGAFMHPSRLLRLALVTVIVAVPSAATATPSLLFSQSGGVATARQVAPTTFDVTLRTAHRAVLAFEDRPGRRTATLPEHKFTGLWRGSFRTDPPNAVLTGRDSLGRNRRVVATISRAARTRDGVRYRMRALRGVMPARLTMANLTVDDVPLSAITAYLRGRAGPSQYEALINALRFPIVARPAATQSLTVPPGTTATLGQGSTPTILAFGTVTVASGATLVLQGATRLTAQVLVLEPGSRIVMPGSPTLVSLTASGLPVCAPPDGLEFQGTLAQARSIAGALPGMTVTQPAPQPWPASSVSASGSNGLCVITWGFNPPPQVAPMPARFPQGPATIVTQSSTLQVVTALGPGPPALRTVVLTVHS